LISYKLQLEKELETMEDDTEGQRTKRFTVLKLIELIKVMVK
jgi:hypothetical protein